MTDTLRDRVETMAQSPCENYPIGTCADDPARRDAVGIDAGVYCWPCRLRAALAETADEEGR